MAKASSGQPADDLELATQVDSSQPSEKDWLNTALLSTSRVQSAAPREDLTSKIAASTEQGDRLPTRPAKRQAPLRLGPPPASSLSEQLQSISRPLVGAAFGLLLVGAAIVFIVSQDAGSTTVASPDGTSTPSATGSESPPLAPELNSDQPSSGSLDEDEDTTTSKSPTTTKVPTREAQSPKKKPPVKADPITTAAPMTTAAETTVAEETTTVPTTEATTTEAPDEELPVEETSIEEDSTTMVMDPIG